jgi:hypothetical protein
MTRSMRQVGVSGVLKADPFVTNDDDAAVGRDDAVRCMWGQHRSQDSEISCARRSLCNGRRSPAVSQLRCAQPASFREIQCADVLWTSS